MSLILNQKYIGLNNSYRLFITNRFIRLYPIYWIVLLASIIFSLFLHYVLQRPSFPIFSTYQAVGFNAGAFIYMGLENIIIFGQDIMMFLGIVPATGSLFFTAHSFEHMPAVYKFLFVPQAWTLGLELMFYLVAPFILKRGIKTVVVLASLSLLLRFYIFNGLHLTGEPWTYRFFPTELMFFLLGYISYRIMLKKIELSKAVNISMLIGLILFTIFYYRLPATSMAFIPFSYREIAYFTSIVLCIPQLFNFLKNNRRDMNIGELSYPVYICHMLVYTVFFGAVPASMKTGWFFLVITLIVAWLLNKLVAAPMEKFRQMRLKKVKELPG